MAIETLHVLQAWERNRLVPMRELDSWGVHLNAAMFSRKRSKMAGQHTADCQRRIVKTESHGPLLEQSVMRRAPVTIGSFPCRAQHEA